jgi:hypothetical protein
MSLCEERVTHRNPRRVRTHGRRLRPLSECCQFATLTIRKVVLTCQPQRPCRTDSCKPERTDIRKTEGISDRTFGLDTRLPGRQSRQPVICCCCDIPISESHLRRGSWCQDFKTPVACNCFENSTMRLPCSLQTSTQITVT